MNEENRKSEIRSAQKRSGDCPDSRRKEGTRKLGTKTRPERFGIGGTNWERINPVILAQLNGGILGQSIQDAQARLAECEECIVWYGNQKQKILKQLENLQQLQELSLQLYESNEEEE
ncbi:MAG: hypothetical protein ACRC8A_12580 [Microcoleaceae cyanobacterium]